VKIFLRDAFMKTPAFVYIFGKTLAPTYWWLDVYWNFGVSCIYLVSVKVGKWMSKCGYGPHNCE
jgi:hypothetical protein